MRSVRRASGFVLTPICLFSCSRGQSRFGDETKKWHKLPLRHDDSQRFGASAQVHCENCKNPLGKSSHGPYVLGLNSGLSSDRPWRTAESVMSEILRTMTRYYAAEHNGHSPPSSLNLRVLGSIPRRFTSSSGSIPVTWVAVYSGHIGNTFGPNGFSIGSSLQVSSSK